MLRNAFRFFFQLDTEKIDVDCSSVLFLAEQAGLTAYDASYRWVAQKLGADLLTLDKTLENAFREIAHHPSGPGTTRTRQRNHTTDQGGEVFLDFPLASEMEH